MAKEIAQQNNHVYVTDVLRGPLVTWIIDSGLTQEECALIQPTYSFEWDLDGDFDGRGAPHDAPVVEKDADDRERIRKHLSKVEAQLRDQTVESLALALRRKMMASSTRVRASGMDFRVGRLARESGKLRNVSNLALDVRWSRQDASGRSVARPEWRKMESGADTEITGELGSWIFVEWVVGAEDRRRAEESMAIRAPWDGAVVLQ